MGESEIPKPNWLDGAEAEVSPGVWVPLPSLRTRRGIEAAIERAQSPAPAWTREAPKESGWFWWRPLDTLHPECVLFDHEMSWFDRVPWRGGRTSLHKCFEKIPVTPGEWLPVRLEPPK